MLSQNKLTSKFVQAFDLCFVADVQDLAEGSKLTFRGARPDGSTYEFPLNHTYNNNQINWFKAGSALNYMCDQPLTLQQELPSQMHP